MSHEPEIKKPTPRRLFSLESLRSSESAESGKARNPPQRTVLSQLDESQHEQLSAGRERLTSSPVQDIHLPSQKEFCKALPFLNTARSASPDPVPSPSQARWERIRQNVLPVGERPSTPPSSTSLPQQQQQQLPPSASSSVTSFPRPPSRPQTPKSSRFAAKLGFKNVVDHVREAAVDENRKFAEDLLRACWATRHVDPQTKSKHEREAITAGVSSKHLPFKSTVSLGTTATSSTSNLSSTKKSEQRHSASGYGSSLYAPPSVRYLHHVLWQASGSAVAALRSVYLPHESLVLSALLVPFTTTEFSAQLEEERHLAFDAYELVVRTWPPANELATAERCLWCTKAALLPPCPLRRRILSSLQSLTIPSENNHVFFSPDTIQSLACGLFALLPFIASQEEGASDIEIIDEVVKHISSGPVDEDALEEEYDSAWSRDDLADDIRQLLISEAFMQCLGVCPRDGRIWLLHRAVEKYWRPIRSQTPMQLSICSRRVIHFSNASLSLITSADIDPGLRLLLVHKAVQLVDTLIIPEAGSIHGKRSAQTKAAVARVVLEILFYEDLHSASSRWASSVLMRWYANNGSQEWHIGFEGMIKQMLMVADWPVIFAALSGIINRTPDTVRKRLIAFAFPHLTERLVQDPPSPVHLSSHTAPTTATATATATATPSSGQLSALLQTISQLSPQVFFKPLFACAASNRELVVANHLCIVSVLARLVRDWWVRDAEMIGVALMSDVSSPSGEGGVRGEEEKRKEWAGVTLGQYVILLELINTLKGVRRAKDSPSVTATSGDDAARVGLLRFVARLEVRLAVLIETKEKTAPISPLQRMLFCVLFREIRLLTRSLKPAPWLPIVLKWFKDYFHDQELEQKYDDEIEHQLSEIQNLYILSKGNASSSHKRRTHVMMPLLSVPSLLNSDGGVVPAGPIQIVDLLSETLKLVSSMGKGFASRVMKLLVTVSSLMTLEEYERVGPIVWYHGLGGRRGWEGVMPLVCFLAMQCAEKTPLDFRAMMEVDMCSSDDLTRLEAIRKIGVLVNWRFQLMSQHILVDRNHRPFKLARAPLPFVPTDMGSANYIHNENPSTKAKDVIPMELRKQLAEIGWADDSTPVDHREKWVRTPVSLLPVNQVERLDQQRVDHTGSGPTSPLLAASSSGNAQLNPTTSTSPSSSKVEEGELLRRNSSSGGPTFAKRRAVFVPALSLVFRVLARLVYDPNHIVASAARDTLIDLMRNDPGILLRPVLDLFCGDQNDLSQAISILTALLHTRYLLPPPMTHAIFNNLAGFLKFAVRQAGSPDSLHDFALVVPIMAHIAKHVGDLTIREIKRSKMEHFLIPYGTLWFNQAGAPSVPMFPRSQGVLRKATNPFEPIFSPGLVQVEAKVANPFEALNPKLVSVIMIRIAQNMMFVDMLKKSSQDVVLVRKVMPRFIIPTLEGETDGEEEGRTRMLELNDFVPLKEKVMGAVGRDMEGADESATAMLNVLSLALARSYVTLVAQMFRCMSRNTNDREEMANFMDGLNRILLAHADDIGIVGHVLIAFMVACARFRRLFTSGGGYALFMPALAKVYAESGQRVDLKLAIEYAVYRFYSLHREAFLFQSLDVIAHIATFPGTDPTEYAAKIYELFYSLRSGVAPTDLDPAGIHDSNQSQEKEALLFNAAEDRPQTFLTAIRRGEAQTNGQIFFDVSASYTSSRLKMEDFVKLFLTIIAHDPALLRSEYFMRMLRYLAPHIYNASPQARHVLQEGLSALGTIFLKPFSKPKVVDPNNASRTGNADVVTSNVGSGSEGTEKNKSMSNSNVMRLDLLFSLIAVAQAGCPILTIMPTHLTIEIAKSILKESPVEMLQPLSKFFGDLTKHVILSGEPSKPKPVLSFLHEMIPVIRAFSTTLNFTFVFETITRACAIPPYSRDPVFAKFVIQEACSIGLDAFEVATSEAELSKLHFRTALVPLLAEAVFLHGADVVGELEKRRPSFYFLANVILPLTLTLKTTDQLVSEGGTSEAWHHPSLSSSWIRLLLYSMMACQRSRHASDGLALSRTKSREKRNKEQKQWGAHLPTFITALQIIKVIVIRAENEISTTLPDLWHRLTAFLRSVLMDGNANFALHRSSLSEFSPLPSPTPSPRVSRQFDRSSNLPSFFDPPGHSTMDTISTTPSARPRVIDYALWSTLEFLCAYRSPLRLQLRLFMVEKVVALDQELRSMQRRASPVASPNISGMSRRISTSIFAKPRRSAMFPSPDSSPRVSRPPSTLHEASIPSLYLGPHGSGTSHGRLTSLELPQSNSGDLRIPGYQHSSLNLSTPPTPQQGGIGYIQVEGEEHHWQGPRIVHLGPASPSAFNPPPLSPGGGGVSDIRLMAQSTKIKSLVLIKATCRRIRTVQTFMGYDTLLPAPGMGTAGLGSEAEEISVTTWTRRTALNYVLDEVSQLEEEFEEVRDDVFREEDDNVFVNYVAVP